MFQPSSKRRRTNTPDDSIASEARGESSDDTEVSLAVLLSLHPSVDITTALEALVASKGDVQVASALLSTPQSPSVRPNRSSSTVQQTALSSFLQPPPTSGTTIAPKVHHPRKGETLHLYTPSAVSAATPTTLIPNFLTASLAASLLHELLEQSLSFPPPPQFQLFERTVTSPHTACFFLCEKPTEENLKRYSYQARSMSARQFTPSMAEVTATVERIVNERLKPRKRWIANAAIVNRYAGKDQNVGWHTDQLTYLGPRAIIASVSLGCEREFRVRRAVRKKKNDGNDGNDGERGEDMEKMGKERGLGEPGEGQYSIHLPHNSLLLMHGGMQEAWKHCISPARTLVPHPIAGDVRINITYRFYRESLRPGAAPTCACNLHTILRPVFPKTTASELDPEPQKYFWTCASVYAVDGTGCGFFQYAEFDEDGELISDTSAAVPKKDEIPHPNSATDASLNVQSSNYSTSPSAEDITSKWETRTEVHAEETRKDSKAKAGTLQEKRDFLAKERSLRTGGLDEVQREMMDSLRQRMSRRSND